MTALNTTLRQVVKFGAIPGGERVLTFNGRGTLKTWFEPDDLRQAIHDSLTANGWGVGTIRLTNTKGINEIGDWIPTIIFPPSQFVTWNYQIGISITGGNVPSGTVLNALNIILSQWFTDLNMDLTGDDTEYIDETGQVVRQDNNNPAVKGSNLFGNLFDGFGGGNSSTYLLIGVAVIAGILIFTQTQSGRTVYRRR